MMRFLFTILFIALRLTVISQDLPGAYRNPILPGFHPDPSICRVGDDYYLANSSFEWFPGVPIYHSKDLVNWKLIGHALTRKEQLPKLIGVETSRGIYAPTLRYHNGLFYMITTCVQCDGNFYVTAKDPAGEWSDPVWLKDAPGIDPSLFWDDDGRCWYTGAGRVKQLAGPWPNQNGIWLQELDLKTGKLIGEKYQLTHGHGSEAHYTEGPHLYKVDGRYLLMVAEGGTGFSHAITVFESKKITGPYSPSQNNPVLTHRHLGEAYPISTIGHADMVQTQNGDWWAVMLGKRQFNGVYLLARETFLTPVKFENGWPVFNPGKGIVEEIQQRPALPWTPVDKLPARDEFEGSRLRLEYNFLRTPQSDWFKLSKGKLIIASQPKQLTEEKSSPSMVVRRIESDTFAISTAFEFSPKGEHEEAGITLFRNAACHYKLAKTGSFVVLTKVEKGTQTEVARQPFSGKKILLKAKCENLKITFSYGETGDAMKTIGSPQNVSVLSDNVAGGFNGPYAGIFASSKGKKTSSKAVFDWFEYL